MDKGKRVEEIKADPEIKTEAFDAQAKNESPTTDKKEVPVPTLKAVGLALSVLIIIGLGFLGGFFGQKVWLLTGTKNGAELRNITVQEQSGVIDVVKRVSPSVVSITSVQAQLDFFGNVQTTQASGTGFIVKEDGLILTNKHVVSDRSVSYSVFTSDGKEYDAKVVATDSFYDLAFLKINTKGLTPVEFGDSAKIQVGQRAIAIGNALGQYQNTVTTGVISAVGRAIVAGSGATTESLENMIQTDAAINPGNSGGPLTNINGQVIGVNTAVDSQGQGIGFAIPSNIAQATLRSYLANGEIVHPSLGVQYINVTKEYASRNNLSVDHGALLYSSSQSPAVIPGSPAEKAGLKEADIITKINADVIGNGQSLIGLIAKYNPGDKVTVTYIRAGKESTVSATLTKSN